MIVDAIGRVARLAGMAVGGIAGLAVREFDHYRAAPPLERAALTMVLAGGAVAMALAAFL